MREYILFLDTEASGLPKKWNLPYSDSANWPSAVQIAWIIYKNDGTLVKTEDHYIGDHDTQLRPSAVKIHGVTRKYLDQHGESRKLVMQLFANDLLTYQPLIVGHFMEFDYHIASADFYRAGISNPLENLPSFCTMLASSFYSRLPDVNYLRLGELYTMLFDSKLQNPHNAHADATATALCFFELLQRGDISDKTIELQQLKVKEQKKPRDFPWFFSLALVLIVSIFLSLWL